MNHYSEFQFVSNIIIHRASFLAGGMAGKRAAEKLSERGNVVVGELRDSKTSETNSKLGKNQKP